MRALIAARLDADAAAARDPRSFCQFGPLPIEVIRPFVWLDRDGRRGSRWPSLLAGLAVFPWFHALGRRMLGRAPDDETAARHRGAALTLGALALAVSPLHIQASTTATSEALYLLLSVAAYERLAAALGSGRRTGFAVAGMLASLAAVTRFDAFIALPVAVVATWAWGGRDRRAAERAAMFGALAAVFPTAYLAWNWWSSGDAFFFARYIARDHAQLAAEVTARLGALGGRARQLGVWAIAFAAAMTPPLALGAALALRAWRRQTAVTRIVIASALAPLALYLAKGLGLGDFEPLPRFAIAPGVMLLPVSAAAWLEASRRARRGRAPRVDAVPAGARAELWRAAGWVVGGGVLMGGLAATLAFAPTRGGRGRIWTGGESISPVTRLDAEDRGVAEFLRAHRRPSDGVFIDTWGYADIVIAHAAGVPIGRVATLALTRTPFATLAAARATTLASWFAYHDESWGKHLPSDWPESSARFGHWRVAHFEGEQRR